jgi:leader peptidase (prepilin peptidase)/N-methyltransferase
MDVPETTILLAAAEIRDPLLPLWAMEWLATAFLHVWLFCMGATVGSFLNVVVYRLPRHKNLAYPGSSCPRCGHPIRGHDNIPILSWLLLGGRCRDCRGAISPRYFVVELTVAATFLLVLAAERYLPAGSLGFAVRRPLTPHDGAAFWCMYLTHVVLVTTLIGAVLIRADGFCVPGTLFLPALIVALVLPLIWPEIRSVAATERFQFTGWQAGLIDGVAGLALGLVVATVFGLVWRRWAGYWPAIAPLAMSCSIGAVLGWQRTLAAAPATLLLCLGAARLLTPLALATEGEPPVKPAAADEPTDGGPETPPEELASSPLPPDSDSP